MRISRIKAFWVVLLALTLSPLVRADEGMWLFNAPPTGLLKKNHGFTITQEWLEHLRLSFVSLGASASFASPDGLIITNHHVGRGYITRLSTRERDLLKNGFYARTRDQEIKCPGLNAQVLVGIEDVTGRVLEASRASSSPSEASAARQKAIAGIEREAREKSGLRCQVVTLYAGNMYHLYSYKSYSDVRLVFAPEESIAFFGGDPDNFDYPRFCLDICFFRAYENGVPAKTPNYLKWNPKGPRKDELVFVSGNPGSTGRFLTCAQMNYLRDVVYPIQIADRKMRQAALKEYGRKGPEEARLSAIRIWGLENGLKATLGYQSGLLDPKLMEKKALEEKAFREAVGKDPELDKECGNAWTEIEDTQKDLASLYRTYNYYAAGAAFNTVYFNAAQSIIRGAEQSQGRPKDINLPADTIDELEILNLTGSLTRLKEEMGDSLEVRWILGDRTPAQTARELITRTQLRNAEFRQKLLAGGINEVCLSNDPMIKLALLVRPIASAASSRYQELTEKEARNVSLVLKAWLKVMGTGVRPPDATGTPRLSYGVARGFVDGSGVAIPYTTTFQGLFERAAQHGNQSPYEIPRSILDKKPVLDPKAGFNFITTADAIGGNSGSCCVNRKGEFIGVLHDINPAGLANRFIYSDAQARSVLVNSQAIIETMTKVYDAKPLVDEILGKKK